MPAANTKPENKKKRRIRKRHIVALFFVIAAALLILTTLKSPQNPAPPRDLDTAFGVTMLNVTAPNGTTSTYWAYTATTWPQQQEGYMNQTGLGDCDGKSPCIGMIFLFGINEDACFWMENTEIALQQSWIASNGLVTYVYEAPPENTSIKNSCANGTAVLETLPYQGVKLGDKVVVVN